MVVGEHPGGGRQAPGTDDDAQRLEVSRGGLSRLVTDCEGRVVGEGGAGAHHDGVALTAQVVGVAAGRRRGDPLAGAVVGGNTAVEGGGELPRHHGAAAGHGQEPRAVETRGVLGAQPTPYPHAGGLQRRRAASGLLGRVVLGVNDLGHACGEERLDARAGAALVVARLEGDDGGRSLGGGTCRGEVRQCVDLGVGGAGATVVALGEDVAVGGEDDATDPGVGAGRGVGGGRGPEGASHRGRLHGGERSHPVLSLGCAGERHRHAGLIGCTAPGTALCVPCALPIRTLTVGPGVPPGQPVAGCDRVADCHRRFGLSPTPEHTSSSRWGECTACECARPPPRTHVTSPTSTGCPDAGGTAGGPPAPGPHFLRYRDLVA